MKRELFIYQMLKRNAIGLLAGLKEWAILAAHPYYTIFREGGGGVEGACCDPSHSQWPGLCSVHGCMGHAE